MVAYYDGWCIYNHSLLTWSNVQLLANKIVYYIFGGQQLFWVFMSAVHVGTTILLSIHVDAIAKNISWSWGLCNFLITFKYLYHLTRKANNLFILLHALDTGEKRTFEQIKFSFYMPFAQLKPWIFWYNVFNIGLVIIFWGSLYGALTLIPTWDACIWHIFIHLVVGFVGFCVEPLKHAFEWRKHKRWIWTLVYFMFLCIVATILTFTPMRVSAWFELSPAESRLKNSDCVLLGFFDLSDLLDITIANIIFSLFMVSMSGEFFCQFAYLMTC